MNAKEYLSQARYLDMCINSKIRQVSSLHDLATKATATLSDMPGGTRQSTSRMEDVIAKMVDLENEINQDIDKLVDLKRDIRSRIEAVASAEYRTVLENRYLCFMTWEQIAVNMDYSMQHIFRIHGAALKEISVPQKDESK